MSSRDRLVHDIQQLMTAVSATSAATHPTPWLDVDLSMAQVKALMVLHHRGSVRVGEVTSLLAMSPNATTAVLDRLEDERMVERRPDPADRRAILVQLTTYGSDWITELLSANVQRFAEVLQQLPRADLEALRQGLEALDAMLQAEAPQSAVPG